MVNIQIPKEAIEYLAFNASLEPDYAEELLQTVLGMCKIEAAKQSFAPDGTDGTNVRPYCRNHEIYYEFELGCPSCTSRR